MEIKQVHSKMVFPKVETYKQVYEYFQSIKTLKEMYWKAYEWDKPRHSPDVQLVATQRIFETIEEHYDEKREKAKKARVHLDKQWADLEQKQLKFKKTFRKMNNFIKTNLGKRERAVVICEDEARIAAERTQDIAELREKMELMNETKKRMDKQIMAHRFYEKFLEEVTAVSGEFKSVQDLINRYDSLSATKDELGERQIETMNQLENARARIVKMSEEYSLYILGLNNKLANLNQRYNVALNKALHWESLVWAIRKDSFIKYSEINQVKHASWNIYLLMCKRKGEVPKLHECDFEEQLIFIKKTLLELNIVNKRAANAMKNLKPSSTKAKTSKSP